MNLVALRLEAAFRSSPATRKGSGWNSCRWEGEMKLHIRFRTYSSLFAFVLLFSVAAGAQQKVALAPSHGSVPSYDLARESALQGTAIEYTAVSSAPPFG